MDIPEIAKQIQHVLAPAVMISSSGLLLLGFQNKYSNLANRFRALNEEKRRLLQKETREAKEEKRLENVLRQVDYLMLRARYIKNAILLMYTSILCFAGTSVAIFVNYYTQADLWKMGNFIFGTGFLCVLAAAVLLMCETRFFYKTMVLERKS